MRHAFAALALAVAAAIGTASARAAALYRVDDLGTAFVYDINNSGLIVGDATMSGGKRHAYVRNGAGGLQDLGTLGGDESYATAVNNKGQIVGSSRTIDGAWHAFRTAPLAAINPLTDDLGTLDQPGSFASAINNGAIVVGSLMTSSDARRPFICGPSIPMTTFGDFSGAYTSSAQAINDAGQIVGTVTTSISGQGYAYFYNGTGVEQRIPTPTGTYAFADARAINNHGQVVGTAGYVGGGVGFAYLYDGGSEVQYLGEPAMTWAYDINNSGQIVGMFRTYSSFEAFICLGTGPLQNLNDLVPSGSGWHLESANLVNDLGQIICSGRNTSNQIHSFLLTPISARLVVPPSVTVSGSQMTDVLSGAGCDIQAGMLVLDYVGGSSPAATVKTLLTTSYNDTSSGHNFSGGQFMSSTADTTHGLGWIDNTATGRISIAYTIYGDVDLNGTVGLSDLGKVLTNWGVGNKWGDGDVDYNAAVGLSDLGKVLTNWGLSVGTLTPAASQSVPEPSSLALLAAGAIGLLACAWRRRKRCADACGKVPVCCGWGRFFVG